MCLGRRPIPIGAAIARSINQEAGKVALGPSATEADAHTFASLRSLLEHLNVRFESQR